MQINSGGFPLRSYPPYATTIKLSHVGRVRFFCAAKKRNPTKVYLKEMSGYVIALRLIS